MADTIQFNDDPGSRYGDEQQDTLFFRYLEELKEENAKNIISQSIASAAEAVRQESSGTTCSMAMITNDKKLITGQVGDSPILVYYKDGQTGAIGMKDLTKNHSPSNPAEVTRVENEGGGIFFSRLNGSLAITRALGDKDHQGKGLSHEPEFDEYDLNQHLNHPDDRVWVVVGSDGITEANYAEEFQEIFSEQEDPTQVPDDIIEKALSSGSTDNTTVTLAKITPQKQQAYALGVFDGHGEEGKKVSSNARTAVAEKLTELGYPYWRRDKSLDRQTPPPSTTKTAVSDNEPTTGESKKNFPWEKVAVASVAAGAFGIAQYTGNNKQADAQKQNQNEPEKKQSWFKKSLKTFIKVAAAFVAVDMVQSAVRGKPSLTQQGMDKIGIGDFTRKILGERQNQTEQNITPSP